MKLYKKRMLVFLGVVACCNFSLDAIPRRRKKVQDESHYDFKLQSSAFANNGQIPTMYTCDGQDISPPLRWENAPPEAQSFAILVDDPDARGGYWTHWVVFDLPPKVSYLPANANIEFYDGIEGVNGWGSSDWGGPCPPLKRHRYKFHIYALRVPTLKLTKNATRKDFLRAIRGKVIAEAVLTGSYQRPLRR